MNLFANLNKENDYNNNNRGFIFDQIGCISTFLNKYQELSSTCTIFG